MRKQIRHKSTPKKIQKHPWYDGSFACIALLFVCIVQALIIVFLWESHRNQNRLDSNTALPHSPISSSGFKSETVETPEKIADKAVNIQVIKPVELSVTQTQQWQGVAACLLLGQPEWFQRSIFNILTLI